MPLDREPPRDDRVELPALYADLAARFRSLSTVFAEFGSPEGAERLMRSLIEPDPKQFGRWTDQLDFPMVGKCVWLQGVIERVLTRWTGKKTVCWIRENLTAAERGLLFTLIIRYQLGRLGGSAATDPGMTVNGHPIIPEGPFLDALRANNLVTCQLVDTYDSWLTQVPAKPELVCL